MPSQCLIAFCIKSQPQIGQTCLHNAASGDQLDVARLLVQRGGKLLLYTADEVSMRHKFLPTEFACDASFSRTQLDEFVS